MVKISRFVARIRNLAVVEPTVTRFTVERFAPVIVTLFHLAYGAILGVIYGKLVDTEEARSHLAGHVPR